MRRRIKQAKIKFISLVPRGANQIPVIFKSDDSFDLQMLTKAPLSFAERGELLAVVYAPEIRDSQGDIADASVIRDMMHDFAKSGEGIDITHDGKAVAKAEAFVAESFEIQKGDERFADMKDYNGKPIDVTGGWGVVIKITKEELKDKYRKGEWNGVSMSGTAVVEAEKSDLDPAGFIKALADHLKQTTDSGDLKMTNEELKKMLEENNKTLLSEMDKKIETVTGKGADPAPKPADKGGDATDDKAPVFKGEPTVENLRKHRLAVRRFNVLKDIDWSNDESVLKAETDLAEIEKELKGKPADASEIEKAAGIESGDSDEVKALKIEKARVEAKLASTLKKSNQPGNEGNNHLGDGDEDGSFDIGKKMGTFINKSRGY